MVTKFQILPIDKSKYHFANYYWDIEAEASHKSPYTHSLIPKGISGLIYIYRGAFKVVKTGEIFKEGELIFGAQRNTAGKFEVLGNTGLIGVSLRPYVASIMLDRPGSSLINQIMKWTSKECLIGLEGQLNRAKSNNERVIHMQAALKEIKGLVEKNDLLFCKLIDEMAAAKPSDLDHLVAKSNLSLRQFQRKFKSLTGYSPTEYLRIARILPVLSSDDPKSLTELAFKSGYYDQSHFINQFKKITDGITPREYFDGTGELKWKVIGENVSEF